MHTGSTQDGCRIVVVVSDHENCLLFGESVDVIIMRIVRVMRIVSCPGRV